MVKGEVASVLWPLAQSNWLSLIGAHMFCFLEGRGNRNGSKRIRINLTAPNTTQTSRRWKPCDVLCQAQRSCTATDVVECQDILVFTTVPCRPLLDGQLDHQLYISWFYPICSKYLYAVIVGSACIRWQKLRSNRIIYVESVQVSCLLVWSGNCHQKIFCCKVDNLLQIGRHLKQ